VCCHGLVVRDCVSARALTAALSAVQASGGISVHALVHVHNDISPGPHSLPGGRSRGRAARTVRGERKYL